MEKITFIISITGLVISLLIFFVHTSNLLLNHLLVKKDLWINIKKIAIDKDKDSIVLRLELSNHGNKSIHISDVDIHTSFYVSVKGEKCIQSNRYPLSNFKDKLTVLPNEANTLHFNNKLSQFEDLFYKSNCIAKLKISILFSDGKYEFFALDISKLMNNVINSETRYHSTELRVQCNFKKEYFKTSVKIKNRELEIENIISKEELNFNSTSVDEYDRTKFFK